MKNDKASRFQMLEIMSHGKQDVSSQFYTVLVTKKELPKLKTQRTVYGGRKVALSQTFFHDQKKEKVIPTVPHYGDKFVKK